MVSCASIQAPTGGEKDVDPPRIEQLSPENFSTNFKGDRIVILFDEYVQLKNIYEQFLVSPPLSNRPEIIIKGKTVIIDLQEELSKNTTYTFHLGEGIADNNEGNILDSNKVVFSTGAVLDSLSLYGTVNLAENNRPVSSAVMLFKIGSDSSIVNERPAYFTRSTEDGEFRFEYLAEGDYQLFALEDLDKNYNWSEAEKMAFYGEDVKLDGSDSLVYHLKLFEKVPDSIQVSNSKGTAFGQVELVFNKEPINLAYNAIGFEFDSVYRKDFTKDSLRLWFKNVVPFGDCKLALRDNSGWKDTIDLFAFESKKEKELPELKILNGRRIDQNPNKKLSIYFSNPIEQIDESKIVFILDTLEREINFELIDPLESKASIEWSEWRKGSIGFFPGAIQDIYGQTNDTTISSIKILGESDFSEFSFRVQPPYEGTFILKSFLDKEPLYQQELIGDTILNWTWLMPGKMEFILIDDKNQNGIWDSGDYFRGKEPEPTWSFGEEIQLRPNWSLEQEWIIEE